jgi:hypothetical protein
MPELSNPEVPDHRGEAAEMIFVGVGEHDNVNLLKAARPQVRGDNILARVPPAPPKSAFAS